MDAQELQQLKELAKAATTGPWDASFPTANGISIREADCQVSVNGALIANVSHGPIFPSEPFGSAQREANATFIAAANPAAVLKLIEIAERAVSPGESVNTLANGWPADFHKIIKGAEEAAHAEGRRSAMEELAKEKERADRAEADLKALQSLPAGEHPGCVELIRENHQQHCRVTHALMAERDQFKKNHAEVLLMLHSERIIRQAPDLSKLERYDVTYSGMDDSPDGAWVKFADVQALLAQPLQQEGGK